MDGDDWPETFNALGFKDVEECYKYVTLEAHARVSRPSNLNPGPSWEQRKDVWQQFLEEDGTFSYTYPQRIHTLDQIQGMHFFHAEDPQSRQLLINIYEPSLDHIRRGGRRRIPCSMYYQLLHRGNFLYFIVNMRSCDLYTHFPVDLSIGWLVAEYFKQMWGIECLRLMMQLNSLHAFEKDLKPRGIF